MAKFIIDIKDGNTKCENCPFIHYDDNGESSCCLPKTFDIDCDKYDMCTMQIIEKID